jgi:hypothetical protein
MHISEMAKWTGKGGPPGLYKRWRPLGVELALFRISGCFCDFQIHCDFPAIFKFKRTKMYGNWGNILPGTPLLKDFNMPFVVSPLGPRRPIQLSKKRLFIYVRAPAPFTIQTWNFPFLVAFLNPKIQNDRNTLSYARKFNMHISEILERMARAPSRRRACAFLRLWLLLRFSEFKMTAIHGHMGKNSTCIFPKFWKGWRGHPPSVELALFRVSGCFSGFQNSK